MFLPKIIFVTNMFPSEENPSLGTFVRNGYLGLQKLGRDVSVISLKRGRSTITSYIRFYWQTFLSLKKFHGIAYVHYVSHSALPALAAKLTNKHLQLALHFHGSDAFPESYEGRIRAGIKKLICSYAIQHADTIIVPSDAFADRLAEKFNLERESISVNASAGVNEEVFQNTPRPPQREKQILFASRMIPGKGAVTTARILKTLFTRLPSTFHATLIGAGPEREEAEEILREQINDNSVTFIGPVDQQQLAHHYRNTDIFIFASTRKGESLGLVLIEAIFCGAVPVAFDNLAARSILEDSHTSALVAKNGDELLNNLNTLLNLSNDELHAINTRLRAGNRHYESGNVSRELSEILA